jgi:prepilin-type N-terminal cleavage/methylation domain-containing protein
VALPVNGRGGPSRVTNPTAAPAARWTRALWPAAACLLALVPVLGVFTRSNIFYVRDLSFFFWSRHLWLRHTILSGSAPWWDPYVAGGQSATPDALNQILMPITLAIRLLPSDIVSFNLWVTLPLPCAAFGMYLFLARNRGAAAAALGAIAFVLAGVTASMLNTPNLAWSIAALPWILWGTSRLLDAPSITAMGVLAAIFALQALSGEPVSGAATAVLVCAYAAFGATDVTAPTSVARTWRGVAWTVAAIIAGALLAAAQLLPTFLAGIRAHRGGLPTPDFWSLHPLAAVEVIAPHLFGNYYDAFLADIPWMTVLNSGRDPFFYSIYVGPLVLLLAIAGVFVRPRRGIFWGIVVLIFAIAAMGGYTPLYPLLRKLVPALGYFRFPVKYLAISVFGCAVLAADAWDALGPFGSLRAAPSEVEGRQAATLARVAYWAGCAAVIVAVLLVVATFAHQWSWNRAYRLAAWLTITRPDTAADLLLRLGPPLLGRAAGLLMAGAALLAIAASNRARAGAAAYLLIAAVAVDLAITNAELNLTTDVRKLMPPRWYTQLSSSERVYIGGRVRGFMNTRDPDAAQSWKVPAERTAIEGRMELNAELPMAPSGWRVREALSYDLPVLWPSEYEAVVRAFEHAGRPQRDAFLRRSGVRWCIVRAPSGGTPVLTEVAHWEMRLVECGPSATRVFVSTGASVGADQNWQRAALFDTAASDDVLRLASTPASAGVSGTPEPPSARITHDADNEVVIEAALPANGYVVLRDSYDSSWRADVDGRPAEIARANGLYRAVRLPAGRHSIRFRYRPRDLFAGLTISGMTACILLLACGIFRLKAQATGGEDPSSGWRRVASAVRRKSAGVNRVASAFRRKSAPYELQARGFTLIELMIVMAIIGIILAIAFARYHNMQARGNEASAIASLRSIAAAEWSFAQTCGKQKYAPTLPALGQPVPSTGEAFLSPDLTSADIIEKSGYQFHIAAKPLEDAQTACNGVQLADGYAATADPVTPGATGTRFFAVNADRLLHEDSQTFKENMPESGPPGHGAEVR